MIALRQDQHCHHRILGIQSPSFASFPWTSYLCQFGFLCSPSRFSSQESGPPLGLHMCVNLDFFALHQYFHHRSPVLPLDFICVLILISLLSIEISIVGVRSPSSASSPWTPPSLGFSLPCGPWPFSHRRKSLDDDFH